jgi:hypothetical protein
MKSWKTTAAGVGGLMTAIGSVLNQLFDGNPATNPDWNVMLPIIFTSLIGIFARDNGVSSEQVGADEATKHIKKFGTGPVPMILLTALLAFGAMTTFTGCASGPQTREAVVYKSFRSTWTTVLAAHDVYCERAVLGKVKPEDMVKVDAAWNRFRAVFKVTFTVAQRDWTLPAPATLDAAERELLALIRSL